MRQAANIQINDLIFIARKAGKQISDIYNQNPLNWELTFKNDNSPLTMADKLSNTIICNYLKEFYPEIPIISEENKNVEYEIRKNYQLYWLIDPLDGTKEFIKRNGEFTVNIALIEKNKPIAGVVYIPVSDKFYYACIGEGAWCKDSSGTNRINAANFDMNEENLSIVASRSHFNADTENFVQQFKNPVLVSKGSSLKFMLIAEGKAHIYPRLGPTMEWDTAAAQIIVEEAGGKVVDFYNRKQLKYNKEQFLNPFFIVTGIVKENS